MLVIGLTGSIGMGKSTTANMFRAEGICVHDSDAAVHALYREAAVPLIAKHFPDAIVNGAVDRARLGVEVLGNSERMKLLESIIHPLVGQLRTDFVTENRRFGHRFVVVDIPLLFEIGGENEVDLVVVCSAPEHIQAARVLARPGMTHEKFQSIRDRQVADEIKRRRAHCVIDTSFGLYHARTQVRELIRSLSNC